ncbi:MAG: hypothetical protein HC921_08530 [Synechococcaceae cyanobacterium SM2_3_1]|nr:hypothetical protein [Synechococcaceae cyanobacterium SM2_3_1]
MTDEELNDRFGRLVGAQLRFQDQLGDMAALMRQLMAQQQASEQRHDETDQRFNILLQEIRYSTRQLWSQPEEELS